MERTQTVNGIEVTINLDEIIFPGDYEAGIRSQSLLDLIISAAGDQLVKQLGREQTDRIRAALSEERQRQIVAAVGPIVNEAIAAAVQPTDAYGHPKGELTTMREVIIAEAKKYLTEARSERYGDPRETPVQRMIREEVGRTVKTELQKALKEAQAEVYAAVRAQGAAVIQETIARMSGAH